LIDEGSTEKAGTTGEVLMKPQDIDSVLQQSDKAGLISLIKRMLSRYPDLGELLLASGKTGTRVDPRIYRNRVEGVFRAAGDDWEVISYITDGLLQIVEIGHTLVEQQDYADASAVYEAVVSGVMERYEEYTEGDEDGELDDVVAECITGLQDCLAGVQDNRAVREPILRMLFTIYRFDIDAGGIGFGEDAPDVLIQNATADERQTIVGWVYEAIAEDKQKNPHITYESHWYNGFAFEEEVSSAGNFSLQCLGNFLLDLQEDALDDATYLRICLETGRISDAIERMLELGRIDEAVQATQQADDYTLLRIADLFVQSGQEEAAEGFMQRRVWRSRNVRIQEWLGKHAKSDHDREDALQQAITQFQDRPSFQTYEAARQLSTECGYWEKTRPELLTFLKSKQLREVLTQVAMDEDDTDEIVQIIQAAGWASASSSSIVALVEAAEETQPEIALHFYQRYAACLIGGRNRPAYEQATRILIRIRTLYERLGKRDNWTRYIKKLHEQSKSLKVFRNILSTSGL
jgi:hypothetical protein